MNPNQSNYKNYMITRFLIIIFNDLVILNFSLYISYFLRLDYFINIHDIAYVFFISSLIYLIFFNIFELSKQYFRYFNLSSLTLYTKLFLIYLFIFTIFVFIQKSFYIPRSLVIIFPVFFFILLITNRFIIAKIFFQTSLKKNSKSIIFGFNYLSSASLNSYSNILFYVDNNDINSNKIINGIKIIDSRKFEKIYKRYNYERILIQDDKTFRKSRDLILDYIKEKEILVQKISYDKNNISTSPYFDFNYFFKRRSKVSNLSKLYENKVILITGAGGSIGSNIALQLIKTKFRKLILIENSEYNLYKISNNINLINKNNIISILANFSNELEMKKILNKHNVEVIFHAAAYKHVPLIETNPFAAISNNFINTYNFANLVMKNKIPFFCLISSDKAVRPTNIMGASKRLAELSMSYLNKNRSNTSTTFCSVRFGNVINSSGSVMPMFMNQIEKNGPVTITHKDIIRYFMTIEEAGNLVLNIYKVAKGGETFLLDMGNPIKLLDLAKLMIQFSGKTLKQKNQDGDISIKFIGLRKGEKLFEELLIDDEARQTRIKHIFQSIEKSISNKEYEILLSRVIKATKTQDIISLTNLLNNKYIAYKANESA